MTSPAPRVSYATPATLTKPSAPPGSTYQMYETYSVSKNVSEWPELGPLQSWNPVGDDPKHSDRMLARVIYKMYQPMSVPLKISERPKIEPWQCWSPGVPDKDHPGNIFAEIIAADPS